MLYRTENQFFTTFSNFIHGYIKKFYWSSHIFHWSSHFFISRGPRTDKFRGVCSLNLSGGEFISLSLYCCILSVKTRLFYSLIMGTTIVGWWTMALSWSWVQTLGNLWNLLVLCPQLMKKYKVWGPIWPHTQNDPCWCCSHLTVTVYQWIPVLCCTTPSVFCWTSEKFWCRFKKLRLFFIVSYIISCITRSKCCMTNKMISSNLEKITQFGPFCSWATLCKQIVECSWCLLCELGQCHSNILAEAWASFMTRSSVARWLTTG